MNEREKQAKAATNDELVQMWKNAHTTHCLCGGHTKAARNEKLQEMYERELKARGLTPPKHPYEGGQFNGIGAV